MKDLDGRARLSGEPFEAIVQHATRLKSGWSY